MTTKITGYQNSPVQVGSDKPVQRTRDTSTGATDIGAKPTQGTAVQITDGARQMAALEAAVQSLPVVDDVRVAELRLAIEEGRYQVDAERIAEKLLQMESDLASR